MNGNVTMTNSDFINNHYLNTLMNITGILSLVITFTDCNIDKKDIYKGIILLKAMVMVISYLDHQILSEIIN